MKLLRHRGAADNSTTLQDSHFEPAGSEIRGANQAVVSAADDQRIALRG